MLKEIVYGVQFKHLVKLSIKINYSMNVLLSLKGRAAALQQHHIPWCHY